jgi:hypothetical protein
VGKTEFLVLNLLVHALNTRLERVNKYRLLSVSLSFTTGIKN